MSTTETTNSIYRLNVAVYWPGRQSAGDSGTQWEKPFANPQEAWSAAIEECAWLHSFGREVEMWLYQDENLINYAARQ